MRLFGWVWNCSSLPVVRTQCTSCLQSHVSHNALFYFRLEEQQNKLKPTVKARFFKTMFGCVARTTIAVWTQLLTTDNVVAKVDPKKMNFKNFLIGLHMARHYPTEELLKVVLKKSIGTCRKYSWMSLGKIAALKDDKVVWPEEWKRETEDEEDDTGVELPPLSPGDMAGLVPKELLESDLLDEDDDKDDEDFVLVEKIADEGEDPEDDGYVVIDMDDIAGDLFIITVDGVHCRIEEPGHPTQRKNTRYYSHKFKQAGLMYELALHLFKNQIVWANGPFPAGRGDIEIFRKEGLKDKIPINRKVIADKGYRGEPGLIVHHNALDTEEVRLFKKRAMARQESLNHRIKNFKILAERFRHKEKKHQIAFLAVVVLIQFQIESGYPLFSV